MHAHATAPLWGIPKTRQDERDRKMTFLAQGTADRTAKNMMGQTNIHKAKLLKLTLTRTFDPNRPTMRGII